MHWSTVPFGKYEGKTLPEIIVRDLDWFFWMLPKLYGKLAEEAQELARKHAPSKFQRGTGENWRSNIDLTSTTGFAALRSSTPRVGILDGQQDFHTSTCRGLFVGRSMTSERAAS